MRLPLESVPNFSEGRDQPTLDALADALSAKARLLDVHADADHNRSVFTLVADEDDLLEALVAATGCARERIDLRRHEGAHPRVGAADVVPVVPVRPGDLERAKGTALELAERIGGELELPRAGLVQVSMNVEDWEAAALHELLASIEHEATARGAEVVGSELVGLMPGGAAAAAAGAALRIDGFDASRVLELRLLEADSP